MGSNTNWGRDYGQQASQTAGTVELGAATKSELETISATQGAAGSEAWQVRSSGSLTDRSGTITTGSTAQNAMAANTSRKYASVTNPIDAAESLWVNDAGTATAASPSYELAPGDEWSTDDFVPTNAISVIAATTGHAFIAREG